MRQYISFGGAKAFTGTPSPPPDPPDPPDPPVVQDFMWISPAEMSAYPMSGSAWTNVLNAADTFTSSMVDYTYQNSEHGSLAMASAIVFARSNTESYRTKVAAALDTIVNNPYNKSSNPTALGWARNMMSWIVAAQLIDLPNYNPTLEGKFQTFLANMPEEPYSGDGGVNLRDLADSRPNNIGAFARCAMIAIALYTNNSTLLDQFATICREFIEGESTVSFGWGSDQSWQENPGNSATWLGIVRQGATKDGHNIDGIIPDDYRRNASYNSADFPGPATTSYPMETMQALIGTHEMLRRSGYPDALTWGDSAILRAWIRFKFFCDNYAADGWEYPGASGGNGDDRSFPYVINKLFSRNDPVDSVTAEGRPISWADFTHQ